MFYNGTITDLGTLPGGTSSTAIAVNQAGQVVGDSTYDGLGTEHAFLYSNGTMTDLGTLDAGPYGNSFANAINSSGQIVGSAQTINSSHAFLYSEGTMYDLGTLPGFSNGSTATSINDGGEIVGDSYNPANPDQFHGFVYTNGAMYDLNDLLVNAPGYVVTRPSGINSSGQIVSYAVTPSGQDEVVLLTPTSVSVPPAAWEVLAALPLLLILKQFRPGMSRSGALR